MQITEVKVYPAKDNGRLKAYATIVFDNDFIVRDLKVIEGDKGLFVSMPSRRRKDGSFRDWLWSFGFLQCFLWECQRNEQTKQCDQGTELKDRNH